MKKILICLFCFIFCSQAFALKIVATVGDEVITDTDIKERQALLENIFNMDASSDMVLDTLIEEKVKLISAASAKVSITPGNACGWIFLRFSLNMCLYVSEQRVIRSS